MEKENVWETPNWLHCVLPFKEHTTGIFHPCLILSLLEDHAMFLVCWFFASKFTIFYCLFLNKNHVIFMLYLGWFWEHCLILPSLFWIRTFMLLCIILLMHLVLMLQQFGFFFLPMNWEGEEATASNCLK